mmetsp:Transcript_19684/g.43933  ORF Transcript_19684/g.43933 Transcript_19684/m.43933 type:complete len:216 (-) Transcript_19684:246-893(-)
MRPVARRGGGVRRRCRGCRHSSHTGGSWRRCSGWLRGCQGDNLRRAQLLCGCVPPRLRVCARGFCHWLRLWALDLRARRRARLHRSVCSLIRRGVGGPGVAATRFLAGARRRRRLDPTLPIVPLPDLAIANLQLGGDLECLGDQTDISCQVAQAVERGEQMYRDPALLRVHVIAQELIAEQVLCAEVVVHLIQDQLLKVGRVDGFGGRPESWLRR